MQAKAAEPKIEKGDALQRLGSLCLSVGAIVLVISNILLPRPDDPGNVGKYIATVAFTRGGLWEASHFFLAVGLWALMIGLAGVYRSISAGAGATWARLGFYGVIVGTTLWTVFLALDGLGLPRVVDMWQKAPGADRSTLFLVAEALGMLDLGLVSMTIIVYWLALSFVGIGMALSSLYPKWMGWALIILGAVTMVAVGLPQAFAGASALVTNYLFGALALLSTIWAFVLGLWIYRRAW